MNRQIVIDGDVAYIPLTRGYTAIIDAVDVPLVEGHNWYAKTHRNTIYARRNEPCAGKQRHVMLHRVISGLTDPSAYVDHVDGDGLNNRRANLRECSHFENQQNSRRRRNNTSGFKGVCWHACSQKWTAQIKAFGTKSYLGLYATAEEAHVAYCTEAEKLHGKFARVA